MGGKEGEMLLQNALNSLSPHHVQVEKWDNLSESVGQSGVLLAFIFTGTYVAVLAMNHLLTAFAPPANALD